MRQHGFGEWLSQGASLQPGAKFDRVPLKFDRSSQVTLAICLVQLGRYVRNQILGQSDATIGTVN